MSDTTHLLIIRVAGPDADSASATVKVGYEQEPGEEKIADMLSAARSTFEWAFGEPPAREGYGVLPWSDDEDGDEDNNDDEEYDPQ